MDVELVDDITDLETIAAGRGIRNLLRLQRLYGKGHWRKNETHRPNTAAERPRSNQM